MLWTRHCSRLLQHVRFITNGGASNMSTLPNGVWPTMITPFLNDSSKSVDWQTLDSEGGISTITMYTEHMHTYIQY